jgi:hypothetical protein
MAAQYLKVPIIHEGDHPVYRVYGIISDALSGAFPQVFVSTVTLIGGVPYIK